MKKIIKYILSIHDIYVHNYISNEQKCRDHLQSSNTLVILIAYRFILIDN